MLQVKTKLQDEGDSTPAVASIALPLAGKHPSNSIGLSAPAPADSRPTLPRKANLSNFPASRVADFRNTPTRVPPIIGEANFRGMIAVDGIVSGQPAANGSGAMNIRQRGRSSLGAGPELDGEIRFVDMLRVSRHIAGSVFSEKGTLIVDTAAVIDADVEVRIAIIGGTVNGDIVAHERVEIGPTAKICGNIWTRSLAIQNGAIFEGVCQMLPSTDNGN